MSSINIKTTFSSKREYYKSFGGSVWCSETIKGTETTKKAIYNQFQSQCDAKRNSGISINTDWSENPSIINIDMDDVYKENLIPSISFINAYFTKSPISITIEVTADSTFDDFTFFKHIGEATHVHFAGLQEYIDNSILLNYNNKNTLIVHFRPESKYIPVLSFTPLSFEYLKDNEHELVDYPLYNL